MAGAVRGRGAVHPLGLSLVFLLACGGDGDVGADATDGAVAGDGESDPSDAGSGEDAAYEDADPEDSQDASVDAQTADAASATCDTVAPTECPTPMPTYADVAPIFAARCLSCHDGTQEQWPLTSYSHAADWHDLLRAVMLSCAMPPSGAGVEMPLAERQLLLDWLRCGYPES